VAPVGGRHPRAGSGGALVVESHHKYRPSLMVGACLRGMFGAAEDGEAIADRYNLVRADVPSTRELRPERVTAWRGFAVTSSIPRGARHLHVAEG